MDRAFVCILGRIWGMLEGSLDVMCALFAAADFVVSLQGSTGVDSEGYASDCAPADVSEDSSSDEDGVEPIAGRVALDLGSNMKRTCYVAGIPYALCLEADPFKISHRPRLLPYASCI